MKTGFNPDMLIIARESRRFTQKDMSKKIGITQGTLSKIEKGALEPTIFLIKRISNLTNYPIGFFYEEWEKKSIIPY